MPSRTPPPIAATSASIPAPPKTDPLVGTVVKSIADGGLRVRSQPRVSDDSTKFATVLPAGTQLYVLGGPVNASGYQWYEVASLSSRAFPEGWVASSDRDGDPWIAADDFDCPSMPSSVRSLATMPPAVGVACFARVPITVRARLLSCNCDIDGASVTPDWFSNTGGGAGLLVPPDVRTVPSDVGDWFHLVLDPTGEHPDVLPVNQQVEIQGIFDHPAAAGCTVTEMDGEPAASSRCRLAFAVTRLVRIEP